MGSEIMDIEQLAVYLQRDAREVMKMASRGYIPGQKVSGQWRFQTLEINRWLEQQLHDYSEEQLSALEAAASQHLDEQVLLSAMLSEATIAVPLPASTRASVLKELVNLAEQSWQVYDPDAILEALNQREEMGSTMTPLGVAFPHPHRPLPNALGENVIAFGRTTRPIPYGGTGGETDLFFLVLCRDHRAHLRTLARLARVLRRPLVLEALRAAETPSAVLRCIEATELELDEN